MKTHIIILLLGLLCIPLYAARTQRLILKDGRILEGYIAVQRPGKNITFKAERAEINVAGSDARIEERLVDKNSLSPAWKQWAEENNAFEGNSLRLSTISTKQRTISDVRVIEKGYRIKYLDLSEQSFELAWDTVSLIQADVRPDTLLSGIDYVCRTKDGNVVRGQYVEEVPGKTMSLKLSTGVIQVVESAQIAEVIKEKVNPNQTLFEQAQLIDVIMLKNNTQLRGVITKQNYDTPSAKDYNLTIQTLGEERTVKLSEVEEYRKESNAAVYKPVFDVLLQPDEWLVNRNAVKMEEVEEADSYILLKSDTCSVLTIKEKNASAEITVETRLSESINQPDVKIIQVNEYFTDKKKKTLKRGFTYEDLVKYAIKPHKVETSINHTTKWLFTLNKSGCYAIYGINKKAVILLSLEK